MWYRLTYILFVLYIASFAYKLFKLLLLNVVYYFFGICLGSSSSLCSSCKSIRSVPKLCRTVPGFLFRCHVKTLANCMNFLRELKQNTIINLRSIWFIQKNQTTHRLPMCLRRSLNTKSSTPLRPFSCCSFSNANINSWFHRNSFINSSFCNIIANCSSGISNSERCCAREKEEKREKKSFCRLKISLILYVSEILSDIILQTM